jgi:replicative DNA helicase
LTTAFEHTQKEKLLHRSETETKLAVVVAVVVAAANVDQIASYKVVYQVF